MTNIEAQKSALRARLLRERAGLDGAARQRASAALCKRLDALPELRAARCVAAYVAFRGEIDPAATLLTLGGRGVRVALPRIGDDGQLSLHAVAGDEPLVRNALGIDEPAETSPLLAPGELDVILVPAVAADRDGRRLGFGRGFYDRLLPRHPGATAIAVLHDMQLVDRVPTRAHDAAMQLVVTDARTLRIETTPDQ